MSASSSDQRPPDLQPAGTMIVVVGPSGAGKDTLIDYVASRLSHRSDVHIVRRIITRDPNAGGETHESVTLDEFERRKVEGAFCVSWTAHGLHYGIPASATDAIAQGGVAIANGSRGALDQFAAVFPRLKIVNVVARSEILAARLSGRGRETVAEISQRLDRQGLDLCDGLDVITIDNSGEISVGGEALLALVESL